METDLSCVLGEIYPTEHRKGEGSGLSSSRLGLTDHVPRSEPAEEGRRSDEFSPRELTKGRRRAKTINSRVLQQQRESSLLDFTGLLELHGVDSLEEIGVAEGRKEGREEKEVSLT